MYRPLLIALLIAMTAGPAPAQDDGGLNTAEGAVDEPAETEAAAQPDDPEEPEFDDTGLDVQGFEDLDDDFRPSEEIPADQSIEFPTDI